MSRPERVVVVLGTGTEVGKTWVACRLIEALLLRGATVAARKPAQSHAATDHARGVPTDADLLAAASGADAYDVCPPDRWYPLALAPPMAADRLGRPPIALADLIAELAWPTPTADVGLVEAAGGVRSPLAHDGDGAGLARQIEADLAVVVADAGLGTIHAVRAAVGALEGLPCVVVLNRYDPDDELHRDNRAWLVERDGIDVVADAVALADRVLGGWDPVRP